jgi:tetratricopeptide (TPR) repeat protein
LFKLRNSYEKNEPTFLIWVVFLYGLSHFFCLMPVMRQMLGSWTEVEASTWFLPSDLVAAALVYTWFNRIPEAGQGFRAIWRYGRGLLVLGYLWSTLCLLWLNRSVLFNSDHSHFVVVIAILSLNILAIAYLLRSSKVKAVFASFPPSDQADKLKAAAAESAKAKRQLMESAKLAVPIATVDSPEAEQENRLREMLAADTTNAMGWFELGVMAYQYNKRDQSRAFMNKALACDAQNPIILRSLCELSRQMGRVKEAVRCGREAVALAPKDEIAQLNLALALTDAKEIDTAITHYHRVLDLNPHHVQAWLNLSALLTLRDRKEDALAALDAVLLIDPNQANALSFKQQLIKS